LILKHDNLGSARRTRSLLRTSAGFLTALTLVGCGSTGSEDNAGNARAAVENAGRCEVVPPFVPNFEPELEWEWTGSPVLPTHRQVMMTPVVVDVSGDGVPDVLFNAFAGSNYTTNGVLRAISGADGSDLWTVTDPAHRVRGAASLAAGDIDNDGQVELCTIPESGAGILCFEHDGAFKFRTASSSNSWGGVSFADLDGDGTVELINGNSVFTHTGAIKWVGVDGLGGHGVGPIAIAADIDGDGKQEVVNDRAIYRHDGTLLCRNTSIGHGLAGVGNFDDDDAGEVVVVWSGRVSLLDSDCTLKWTQTIPGGGTGGAPNIADFDNDGQAEIGVAGAARYAVFETNGSLKWSSPTQDNSSNVTGSSTFDFEGDGKAEVIYGDELRLRIYDGATGAVRFNVPHSSGTTYENPVVVDVDADDNAEIVIASNNYGFPGVAGIRVFRDKRDGWVNTRRVWNQHAYSVTNVNEDGTIPTHPVANWRVPGLNTFRSNSQGDGSTSPFAASDLTVSEVRTDCVRATETLQLSARVDNLGDAAASAGLKVAFYAGNPASGGTLLGVATAADVLGAGGSTTVTLALHPAPGGVVDVYAVADDDGSGTGRETECNEANNAGHAPVDLTCVSNLPPVAVCRDVTVAADASCQGGASVDNGSHDPDGQPQPLSLSESPAGPFGLGSHAVTLTAFDGLESARCVGTVTVVDVTPPALTCPAAQVLECRNGGAVATYAAQATDNCGPAPTTCAPPSGSTFPLGQTPVTCSAADGAGNAASCDFSVTVRDTTAPVLGGEKGYTLWPPNHKYVTVTLEECAANAQDACAGELPLNQYGRITRVTSDEVEDANGNGDGRTCQDIRLEGAAAVQVRSEREGTSNGRVYTLHYTVTDASGNSANGTCRVSVPHDQSGRAAVDSGVKYCVGTGCPDGTSGGPLCQE
jgi:hypothetical protein